jgi:hypothetical protein
VKTFKDSDYHFYYYYIKSGYMFFSDNEECPEKGIKALIIENKLAP